MKLVLFIFLIWGGGAFGQEEDGFSEAVQAANKKTEAHLDAAEVAKSCTSSNPAIVEIWKKGSEKAQALAPDCELFGQLDKISDSFRNQYLEEEEPAEVKNNKPEADITININNGNNSPSDSSKVTSLDGKVTCRSDGKYNQDFGVCEQALTGYNIMLASEPELLNQIENKRRKETARMQQQMQLDAQRANTQKKAIDYQIQELEMEKGIQYSLMNFYGAQIAAIEGYVETGWPTLNRLRENCPEKAQASDTLCDNFIAAHPGYFIKNKTAKNAFRMIAATIIPKSLHHRTEGRVVSDRINFLKKFRDEAFAKDGTFDEKGYAVFCQNNPSDPTCSLGGPNGRPDFASFGGGGGVGFTQGSGSGLSFGNTNGGIGDGVTDSTTEANPGLANGLDDLYGDAEAGDSSSEILDAPRAAKIEPGTGAAGGGGGGSGGAGGASAPGLTPESETGTGKKAKNDLNVASYNPYGGKKRKGFRIFSGGSNKKDSKYNPKGVLSGLVPTKQKRGIASMDIADKDIGLFKKVSGRYARLLVDKRIATPEKADGKSSK